MSAGATIKLRRDTKSAWESVNPILAAGEPGLELDTFEWKFGDGVTPWNSLPYAGSPLTVNNSLIPDTDGVYDLGSPSRKWRSLYVTENTIYIGDVALSTNDGNLSVNGTTVATTNDTMSDRGLAGNNWNSITEMGFYTVDRVSWSGSTGTPTDSQVFKGLLEVKVTTAGLETGISQTFFPGDVGVNPNNVAMQFNRAYWNGNWSAWYKSINENQVVDAGGF